MTTRDQLEAQLAAARKSVEDLERELSDLPEDEYPKEVKFKALPVIFFLDEDYTPHEFAALLDSNLNYVPVDWTALPDNAVDITVIDDGNGDFYDKLMERARALRLYT